MLYTNRASLWAVAVMALGAPSLAFIRRRKAPRALRELYRVVAAILSAKAARLATGLLLPLNRLPPEILLPGHNPNQEVNCFSERQRPISKPISDTIFRAVYESMPSMRVRSTPVT